MSREGGEGENFGMEGVGTWDMVEYNGKGVGVPWSPITAEWG